MKQIVTTLMFAAVVSLPTVAAAQPLVPCNGPDCGFDDVVKLAENVIDFLFMLISIIAIIGLVVAGFRLVTSGGNSDAWSKAKSMFTSIILGFLLVISSWLIVDTIMKALINSEFEQAFGPWNEIKF